MSKQNWLKILYLITHSELGGAQKYVLELASFMRDTGNEILIATGEDPNGYLLREAQRLNIQTEHLKHAKQAINPWHDIVSVKEIFRLIEKFKPDIVHLNSSKIGFIGSLAARLSGVHKIIYTAHGFVFNEPGWRRVYGKFLEKISSSWKDSIICVSKHDRITALRYRIAPAEKLITIPLGIDANIPPLLRGGAGGSRPLTRNDARNKLNLPQDAMIIGTIANLYPTKGLQYLIKAAGITVGANGRSPFQIAIVGDGPQRTKLEQLARHLHTEKNIHFLGALPNAAQYIPAFNIFVLPSVKEGWPYTIMEAIVAGIPIVATNVGGIPELIENKKTGLLVPPADPTALAKAIQTLLDDSKLATSLAFAARESIRQFSLEKMLRATQQIYLSAY